MNEAPIWLQILTEEMGGMERYEGAPRFLGEDPPQLFLEGLRENLRRPQPPQPESRGSL